MGGTQSYLKRKMVLQLQTQAAQHLQLLSDRPAKLPKKQGSVRQEGNPWCAIMPVIYFKIPQHRHCNIMCVSSAALLRGSCRIVDSTFNRKRLHSGTSLSCVDMRSSAIIGRVVSLMKLTFQLAKDVYKRVLIIKNQFCLSFVRYTGW